MDLNLKCLKHMKATLKVGDKEQWTEKAEPMK